MDANSFAGENKRPSGLNTLAILSFIMCGIWILVNLFSLISGLTTSPEESLAKLERVDPQMAEKMKDLYTPEMMNNNLIGAAGGLILTFVSLYGVMMMYKLKKTGFYIYTAGELLTYVLSFAVGGTKAMTASFSAFGMGDSITSTIYIITGIMILLDLLFIFLYSRHLKSMS